MKTRILILHITVVILFLFLLTASQSAWSSTHLVKDLYPGPGISIRPPLALTNVNGTLYFSAGIQFGPGIGWKYCLLKTNGTDAGTVVVKSFDPLIPADCLYPSLLTDVNGTLFFQGYDLTNGCALWKSDGTETGTVLVKDVQDSNYLTYLTNVDGTLFFFSFNGSFYELWKSNGTSAGTVQVKAEVYLPSLPAHLNGNLFYSAHHNLYGQELWKSNGTSAGTTMVKDISPDIRGSNPWNLTPTGNLLFFTADSGTDTHPNREMWKTDGNEAGTVQVADICSFDDAYGPQFLTHFGFSIMFSGDDMISGRELWISVLGLGASLVKNINPTPGEGSNPEDLTPIGNTLYFAATPADGSATELWKSDGTGLGTMMVKDINPAGSSNPKYLTNVNGTLFFNADDGIHGQELWQSNGDSGLGTFMVKDVHPSAGSNPRNLINVNGNLFFIADHPDYGEELWVHTQDLNWNLFLPAIIHPGTVLDSAYP